MWHNIKFKFGPNREKVWVPLVYLIMLIQQSGKYIYTGQLFLAADDKNCSPCMETIRHTSSPCRPL